MSRPQLQVYSRTWCHLCEDLLAQLDPLRREFDADVVVIDIDRNPDLEGLYGERVPVLMGGGRELCHYRLDEEAVRAYLLSFR